MLRRLEDGAKRRLRTTLARNSRKKLKSAMRHFAKFAAAVPTRELFTSDPLHNEWTMCLYLEYAAIVPSQRTGRPIVVASADTRDHSSPWAPRHTLRRIRGAVVAAMSRWAASS